MARPFEGIRIIDITHVLAGPFAAYQLGLMGADVIKVEHPDDPDQSRDSGTDNDLNHAGMGTGFLTQGSNKRAITLNLKTEQGRDILKKLVATADVLVENYRPGAFEALGLGYEDLRKINPKLIYASFSAFGQGGPKRVRTAYDHVIQSTSGIMAMTGTPDANPIKIGAPAIDYATGTMGAYALSAALFQRERTGQGQRVDMAMLDVAMILMASHVTGYLRNGKHPKPSGNRTGHATSMAYKTADGMVMLGASNLRQQKRLWTVLERPDLIKRTNDERDADHDRRRTGADRDHADPHGIRMGSLSAGTPCPRLPRPHHAGSIGRSANRLPRVAAPTGRRAWESTGPFTVPVAAFKFGHDGPRVDRPPPMFGQHNNEVLAELGYSQSDIAGFTKAKII